MIYRPIRYEQMMKAAERYDVRARRMGSGMGIYVGECMFAFLVGDDIGLKLCSEDYDLLIKMHNADSFSPSPDAKPMKEYVKLPEGILDDFNVFIEWIERSIEYVMQKQTAMAIQ